MIFGVLGFLLGFICVRVLGRLWLVGRGLWGLRFILPWVALLASVIILTSSFAGVLMFVVASLTLLPLVAILLLFQLRGNFGVAAWHIRVNLDWLGSEISIVVLAFMFGVVMLVSFMVNVVISGVIGLEILALLLVVGIVVSMMGVVLIGGYLIVVVSILLAVFASVEMQLDDFFVVALVLLAWGCSVMIVSVGLIIIVVTGMFDVSCKSVIFGRNGASAVVFVVLGIVLLLVLNVWFG